MQKLWIGLFPFEEILGLLPFVELLHVNWTISNSGVAWC